MQSDTDLIGDVQTGAVAPFSGVRITRTQSASVLADAAELHRSVRNLGPQAAGLRRATLQHHWEDRQRAEANHDGQYLLDQLGEQGMAWRDVARMVGVSVAAVQKWRRGEGITGANRLKLAGIVALLAYLRDNMISEPVSWLEVPIRQGVSVSALDLLIAGRYDLVLELANDEHSPVETANDVLDEFDPSWHTTRVEDRFEVFTAADGVPSIRLRDRAGRCAGRVM